MPRRADDLSTATRLSVVSIVWSSLVGAVAVFAALQSGALSLLGFGVNALIDASASAALSGASPLRCVHHDEPNEWSEWRNVSLAPPSLRLVSI